MEVQLAIPEILHSSLCLPPFQTTPPLHKEIPKFFINSWFSFRRNWNFTRRPARLSIPTRSRWIMNLLTLRWAAIYSDLTKIMKRIKSWKVNLRCVRGHSRIVAVNFARLATFSSTAGEARRIWAACTDSRLAWANRFVQRKAYLIDFSSRPPRS